MLSVLLVLVVVVVVVVLLLLLFIVLVIVSLIIDDYQFSDGPSVSDVFCWMCRLAYRCL